MHRTGTSSLQVKNLKDSTAHIGVINIHPDMQNPRKGVSACKA
jgi:hypothetical protein